MATELDKLIVKIEADLGDLKKGMAQANKEVKNSSKKMQGSFKNLATSMSKIGSRALKLGGILGGVFGAIAIKSIADTGIQIENLQVRLKLLFGSAEEGAKAFDEMVKFASKVPFQLQEIQQASGNLAVVSSDAEELAEMLQITGNVASATGLSFQQTAEQIQRSFAGGIASADVFRERGVRAMLGFEAGVTVSVNDTITRFKEVFGEGGEFGEATNEFAKTLTGTLSMLQDKLFTFKKAIADAWFGELKKQFGNLNDALADNEKRIKEFGREVGQSLSDITVSVIENFEKITVAIKAFGAFIAGSVLATIVMNFTKFHAIFIAGVVIINDYIDMMDKYRKRLKDQEEAQVKSNITVEEALFFINLMAKGIQKQTEIVKKNVKDTNTQIVTFAQLVEITDSVKETFQDAGESISEAFGDSIAKGEDFKDAMKSIFQNVVAEIVATITQMLIMKPIIESLTGALDTYIGKQREAEKSRSGGGGFDLGSVVGSSIASLMGFAKGGFTGGSNPIMVGEKGAEVFVPRTAGNIIPNNQLGGGGSIVINQSLNFATGVVPTVRAEVMNLMPQIKQETVSAVGEARSRGGSFARTFGA